MADIRDVRRLNISVLFIAGLEALLLLFLWLDDAGHFDWVIPTKMLGLMSYVSWSLLFGALFVALIGITALLVYSLPTADGKGGGQLRQVQCQDCKAVFHMPDSGRRPLMHNCPNCRSLGVYDGQAPPVGKPPEPEDAKKIIQLGITCETCAHQFKVTDSGVRPLDVRCQECNAVGTIH